MPPPPSEVSKCEGLESVMVIISCVHFSQDSPMYSTLNRQGEYKPIQTVSAFWCIVEQLYCIPLQNHMYMCTMNLESCMSILSVDLTSLLLHFTDIGLAYCVVQTEEAGSSGGCLKGLQLA